MIKKILAYFFYFEKFIDRWWYSLALSLIAAIDHYVLVFPILGMMISSIFLSPKKWLSLSLWTAVGSWFGAWCLAWMARVYGLSFIEDHFPEVLRTPLFQWAHEFFYHHGVWLVFLMGIAPLPQQPPVIIAALAGTPLPEIGVVLLLARLLKFSLVGYLASHAPQKLRRLRGVDREMREVNL